jgi:hypothetical protein
MFLVPPPVISSGRTRTTSFFLPSQKAERAGASNVTRKNCRKCRSCTPDRPVFGRRVGRTRRRKAARLGPPYTPAHSLHLGFACQGRHCALYGIIMATLSLCGGVVTSRRGLLASLWSLVSVLTAVAFMLALLFTLSATSDDEQHQNDDYQQADQNNNDGTADAEIAVTSRAMAFAALWTAVLATLLAIFGTVVLGWQSPTGEYFTCCSPQVHRTTPIALGSFMGALLMFANLTLVCSVLFGEFEVRRLGWSVFTAPYTT